jgi:hypothetical protein
MNAFQYSKLLESITEYGFIDPILARPCPHHLDFEIVGGKHRWQAAGDLEISVLPVVVRQMTDAVAKKVSLIDNELHGQADPAELIDLLKDLRNDLGPDLTTGLPFTDDILAGFFGDPSLTPVPPLPTPTSSPAGVESVERFVERTYRMPSGAAEVIDQAISKAKEDPEMEDWQALEMIAADFLGT